MPVRTAVTISLVEMHAELRGMGIDPASLDYTRALKIVDVYLGSQAKLNFAGSHEPDGTRWPPLKNPSRRRGGKSAKPLIDKGLLMASMSAAAGRGAVREIDRRSITHGTNLHYAGYQNFGTRTIPARQFAGVTEKMALRIESLVADDVVRQMGY